MNRSESLLNRRVTSIYRTGAVDMVAVFVGATDFQDLVARLDLMRRVGRNDASLVASVKDARTRVETAKRALETPRVRAARTARRRRAASKTRSRTPSRRRRATLPRSRPSSRSSSTPSASARRSLRPRAPRHWQPRAAQRQARTRARCSRSTRPSSAQPHPEVGSDREALSRRAATCGAARRPSGFDCSGLMQYSYAKIGISLPRTSRTQFHAGAYIPPNRLDLLEPGRPGLLRVRRRPGPDPPRRHVRRRRRLHSRTGDRRRRAHHFARRPHRLQRRLRGCLPPLTGARHGRFRDGARSTASPPLTCAIMRPTPLGGDQ